MEAGHRDANRALVWGGFGRRIRARCAGWGGAPREMWLPFARNAAEAALPHLLRSWVRLPRLEPAARTGVHLYHSALHAGNRVHPSCEPTEKVSQLSRRVLAVNFMHIRRVLGTWSVLGFLRMMGAWKSSLSFLRI